MSTELELDPSDPLNLLLHNPGHTEETAKEESDHTGAQDWSKFSSMWSDQPQPTFKAYPDLMDFSDFSMNMDMDYSTMGIDPSSLQFNAAGLNFGFEDQNPMSSATFGEGYPTFSFQYPPPPQAADPSLPSQTFTKERRLSVTSSSSSSGASLSPMPENAPSPQSGYTSDNTSASAGEASTMFANDPAAELAHRVRQTAGVMLAVPMNSFTAGLQAGANASASSAKLPIPRLARPSSISSPISPNASTSSISSAASTPPPSTPPSSSNVSVAPSTSASVSNSPTPTTAMPTAPLPRLKTSHTTIERRYRTNLNARIQSLRMAVPALRVLEDRDGGNGKKIKKNIKGGVLVKGAGIGIETNEDGSVVDVIDERGFVDGVKVARKCSKANVLGKAVEYIRVLKKREQRLKAEQEGLKSLLSGLVGGPALIREWEKQWRAKFGGQERDEVEGEEDADDDDSEDEDGEDGDDDAGRKRKRPKVSPAPGAGKKPVEKKEKKPSPPVVIMTNDEHGNPVPEKRKRGRPRKILPPPVTLNPVAPIVGTQQEGVMQDEMMQPPPTHVQWQQQQPHQPQPQQFLLAVFALFSFFNSPLTSSSMGYGNTATHHAHTGKVLTSVHPPLAYAPEILHQLVPNADVTTTSWAWKEYVQLFHLLVSLLILASFVGNWLGLNVRFGMFSVDKVVERGRNISVKPFRRRMSNANVDAKGGKDVRVPIRGTEGWLKLGEDSVLEGDASALSYFERLQIYRAVSNKRNAQAGDLVTAAMVMHSTTGLFAGFMRMKARSLWSAASLKTNAKVTEKLVLESMDVAEACMRLVSANPKESSEGNGERSYAPLEVLACVVVKEKVKKHLGRLFVEGVAGEGDDEAPVNKSKDEEASEEEERRNTIDAARELGGAVEELGRSFERVWKMRAGIDDDELDRVLPLVDSEAETSAVEADTLDGEIKALITALVLYRRLFAPDDASADESESASCLSESTSTITTTRIAAERMSEASSSSLLSPPPSPRTPLARPKAVIDEERRKTGREARMLLRLRKALGSRVFEDSGILLGKEEDAAGLGLEDAKDRVVDMIVDAERRTRSC